jgi:predicted PurR-regulated permease PerM
MSSLKLGGSVALALAGYAVLVPVALFYMLYDWTRLVSSVIELVPPAWRERFDGFMRDCDEVLGEYLRGQMLVMLALAVFYSVGLSLFGLDLALPIGVFTGLAVFVPYLGFGLGLVLALLAGLLQLAPSQALLMVAMVYGLGQLIESFVLTPRLVGERIGLHPLAVILALMAFGQVLGFVGVLIALPVRSCWWVCAVCGRNTCKVIFTAKAARVRWNKDPISHEANGFGHRPGFDAHAGQFFCGAQRGRLEPLAFVDRLGQPISRAQLSVG